MGFKISSTVHSLNPVPLGHGLFHPLDINAVIELNSSSGQANTTAEAKKKNKKLKMHWFLWNCCSLVYYCVEKQHRGPRLILEFRSYGATQLHFYYTVHKYVRHSSRRAQKSLTYTWESL